MAQNRSVARTYEIFLWLRLVGYGLPIVVHTGEVQGSIPCAPTRINNEIKCISGRHTAAQNAGDAAGEVLGLGSTKQVMEGHDRQRITGTSDTWVKDRPRRLLRFVFIYFLIGADGTQP
jgi:hypothetical protein